MALGYKARRRWSLIILLIGLPVYVVLAVTLTDWLRVRFTGISPLVELLAFVLLGILWVIPFKFIFRGIGQKDPDADGGE